MLSFGWIANIIWWHREIQWYAHKIQYPYLMVLAGNDVVVQNRGSKQWHAKTSSRVKQMKMMAESYHELTKEPNNNELFEHCFKFMGDRLTGKGAPAAKALGDFDHRIVKYRYRKPLLKRKKFWFFILVLLYFVIGLILAKGRGKKRLMLTWPNILRQ